MEDNHDNSWLPSVFIYSPHLADISDRREVDGAEVVQIKDLRHNLENCGQRSPARQFSITVNCPGTPIPTVACRRVMTQKFGS